MEWESTNLKHAEKHVNVMFSSRTTQCEQARTLGASHWSLQTVGMMALKRETVSSSVLQPKGTSPGIGYKSWMRGDGKSAQCEHGEGGLRKQAKPCLEF